VLVIKLNIKVCPKRGKHISGMIGLMGSGSGHGGGSYFS